MTTQRKKIGNHGEALAAAYLEKQGYSIIEMNWRCKFGEIDIVAQQADTLVFVEVKTRNGSIDEAFAQITPRKRQKLIKSAYAYVNQPGGPGEDALWRIDVIAVALANAQTPHIAHAEDALGW